MLTLEHAAPASPHRWVPAHYSDTGVVTRKCVRCLARQIDCPLGGVSYAVLGGHAVDAEPACTGIPGADERPYRCESCGGVGRIDARVIGGRVVRAERVCAGCEGHGRITAIEALTLLVESSQAAVRCLCAEIRPAYLEQAETLRDERALAYWRRVLALIERQTRAREARTAMREACEAEVQL